MSIRSGMISVSIASALAFSSCAGKVDDLAKSDLFLGKTPEELSMALTRKMLYELDITEEQCAQIQDCYRGIIKDRIRERRRHSRKISRGVDPAKVYVMDKDRHKVVKDQEKLRKILTDEQYDKWVKAHPGIMLTLDPDR